MTDDSIVNSSTIENKTTYADLNNRFIFHVVSSVKGGCGKSTFALFLADYWSSKGDKVYLLDLDTSGTSWKDDYSNCYIPDYGDLYLNDIVERGQIYKEANVWRHLNVEKLYTKHESKINNANLCISDPSKRNEIFGYQIDLFEQAVVGLVEDQIINNVSDDDKAVHIIFDMPPGVEMKSERILRNWLLSQNITNSGLKVVNENSINEKEKKESFEVRLYMMSTLSNSSIAANCSYVNDLFQPSSYYDDVCTLIENGCLSICMILNDITALITNRASSDILRSETFGLPLLNIDSAILNKLKLSAAFIPHFSDIPSMYQHTKMMGLPSIINSLSVNVFSIRNDCGFSVFTNTWELPSDNGLGDVIESIGKGK